MSEKMGGIVRISHRNDPHPDLMASRIQEQREREKKTEKKEKKPEEDRVKFSKLQWAIINECIKNGWETNNYSAPIETIIDVYYGERSGIRIAKRAAVHRAIRTLDKKGLVKLMPGLCGRVELEPGAVEIAKGKKPEKFKNK